MTAFKMRSKEIIVAILWMISLIVADVSAKSHHVEKRQIGSPGQRVVCYFANWAVYRQGTAKFTPQNINPYLCTHLIYAFGGLTTEDTIQPFDKYQDIEKGGYSQFAALKTYNKELKTLLAIGGWNEGSKRFSPMVADPARRRTFIKSSIRFLRQYNFDGIDLDWEYPAFRDGGKPQDRVNYAKLIIDMREAFDLDAERTGKERLLITMAVPASLEYASKGFDIKELDKHLDWFNFLTYDYHSSYEPSTNHHSPLFRPKDVSEYDFRADLNIDATVKHYIKSGASRDKIVLGIPTYGRSYTLINPDAHAIGSPTDGPGEQGKGTKEDGYLAYYEICDGIKNQDWIVERPNPGIVGPYAHKDNFWVGYDDINAAMDKAIYVSEEGLGGIMFWTIDNDDFRGACHDKPFQLIESAKEALFGKVNSQVKTSFSVSTSEQTRVERVKLTSQQLEDLSSQEEDGEKNLPRQPLTPRPRAIQSGTVTVDPFNTPSPPTTPRNEPAFECQSEGFFPHKTICKKYYWCLETAGLGMVAHTFTCPGGLYFNVGTSGCDFSRNVDCGEKDTDVSGGSSSTTTETPYASFEDDSEEDPQSLKGILASIKAAGGLEAFEDQLQEEEERKEELVFQENTRKTEISSQTRNRLNQLLGRKKSESNNRLRGGDAETTTETSPSSQSQPETSTQSTTEAAPNSSTEKLNLLGRLANRRLTSGGNDRLTRLRQRFQTKTKQGETSPVADVEEEQEDIKSNPSSSSEASQAPTTTARSRLFRNRNRFALNRGQSKDNVVEQATSAAPRVRNILRGRDRFRNTLARPSASSPPPPEVTSTEASSPINPDLESSEDETTTSTLRPNRFRPKSGTRDRLRSIVQESLEEETGDDEPAFITSDKQRVPPVFSNEPVPALRPKGPFKPEYVILNRGPPPTAGPLPSTSTARSNLEYVTLSRGSSVSEDGPSDPLGSPSSESESQFVTPLPFDAAIRDENNEEDDFRLGITQEPARSLEYVTLRRGQSPGTNTVQDFSDEVLNNQVGDFPGRSRGASGALLQGLPRAIRSAADPPVSIVFPTLNARNLPDENAIPDLPVRKDVSYIFPFSPTFKRDHRQTSPLVGVPTTPESDTTTIASSPIITTTPTLYENSQNAEEIIADVDDEDFNEDDYEVSVSVSKTVSESFSVSNDDAEEDIAAEIVPIVDVTEQPQEVEEVAMTTEDDAEAYETSTTTTTSTSASSTEELEQGTTTSRFQGLLNKRKNSPLTPKRHPILSTKSNSDPESKKLARPAKNERHPFFKQRPGKVSFGATTTTESSTTTQEVEDDFEDVEGSGETTTESSEPALETETTTKGSYLSQKIQERLEKAAEEKKSSRNPSVANNKFSILGSRNRNNRPKFVLPNSFKQQRLQEKEEERDEEQEDSEILKEREDIEPNEIEESEIANEIEPVIEFSSPSPTRPSSRFKPKSLFRPRPAGFPKTTRPLSKFTTQSRISTTTPTTDATIVDFDESESTTTASTRTTLPFRSRIRPIRPLDLSPSPSRTISKVSRGETATVTPTTTPQLSVADLLAELQGDNKDDDKPATLRPKSFKPKFGSRQRDQLREKLKEQLDHEESGDEDSPLEIQLDEPELEELAPQSLPPTGGRRTINRPRSRAPPSSPRLSQETPRNSPLISEPFIRPRNSLRSRPRARPQPNLRQPVIGSIRPTTEEIPLPTPTIAEESSTEAFVSGRQLSNSDIMTGLGLSPSNFNEVEEEVQEEPLIEEFEGPIVEQEEPAPLPSQPISNDPNDFLLQLVQGNQRQQQAALENPEAQEESDEGVVNDTPIMQNPSLLVTPAQFEPEFTTAGAPFVFNPEQLLKSAIVESNLPSEITAKPKRVQKPRPIQVISDDEPEEAKVYRPSGPRRRPAGGRRVPPRGGNRFIPPTPAQSFEPEIVIEAEPAEVPERVVSEGRQRVRSRARIQPVRRPIPNEIDNEIDTEEVITPAPSPVPRRAPSSRRGRIPLRTRARLVRPSAETVTRAQEGTNFESSVPASPAPEAQFVPKRGSSRSSATRVRSRKRIVNRGRAPIASPPVEDIDEAEPEVQQNDIPSEAVSKAERPVLDRSRVRIRGKSRASNSEVELTAQTNLETEEELAITIQAETTTSASSSSTLANEDFPPITTHRPITLRPLFGARSGPREPSLGSTIASTSGTSEPTTESVFQSTAFFGSVSPSSGVNALPAAFFTTFSPKFSSFPPQDFGNDLKEERGSFARVERSTLGSPVDVTTPSYHRLGVSGHAFKDVSIVTEPTVTEPTLTTTTEAKEELSTSTEEVTETIKPKLVKKTKIKIKKSLFGRKRPNFLKALEKNIAQDRKKDQGSTNNNNLLFGRAAQETNEENDEENDEDADEETDEDADEEEEGLTSVSATEVVEVTTTPTQPENSTQSEDPTSLLAAINVTPSSPFSRSSFRRPRRKLDLNGLKSLFSRKNSLSEKEEPSTTESAPSSVTSSSTTFVPTLASLVTTGHHLTGLNESASTLVQGESSTSSTTASDAQTQGTSEAVASTTEATTVKEDSPEAESDKAVDRRSFLKTRLKNKIRYGRKSFASAASNRKFAPPPSPAVSITSSLLTKPLKVKKSPLLKRKPFPSGTSTTTTTTSSSPSTTSSSTSSSKLPSTESQGNIETLETVQPDLQEVSPTPATVVPESSSSVESVSTPNRPLRRNRPFAPRAGGARFSFPTRNTTPSPPRRSSVLALSNPTSLSDQEVTLTPSSSPAPTPPQRQEPRKIEISPPFSPSSVAPPLSQRPEEQLFRQVSQFKDASAKDEEGSAFETRFEGPISPAFTIVDGTEDRPEGPIVATAIPLLTTPTARPTVRPLARSPSPSRRRPQVQTTTTAKPEYEYYYEYYYDDDEEETKQSGSRKESNLIPESRSKPIESIDDYDIVPLTNKVEILPSGRTLCHDVGVFPHPHSCRKFVMCSRRTTRDGITGWEYECPIYLAFDPVGGRCNWASDVVCS